MKLPALTIFDMDGLIFDSERLFCAELGKAMQLYGFHLSEQNYIRTIGAAKNNAKLIMQELYGEDYPFEEISAIARERVNEIAAAGGLTIKPGIENLLAFFKEHNVTCCVASSSPQQIVEHYMTLAGLRGYFSGILGGENVRRSKPEPDIFLEACRIHDTAPGDALVLEDSENGIMAALRAGIPVIAIPDMIKPRQELIRQTVLTALDAWEVISFFQND